MLIDFRNVFMIVVIDIESGVMLKLLIRIKKISSYEVVGIILFKFKRYYLKKLSLEIVFIDMYLFEKLNRKIKNN